MQYWLLADLALAGTDAGFYVKEVHYSCDQYLLSIALGS